VKRAGGFVALLFSFKDIFNHLTWLGKNPSDSPLYYQGARRPFFKGGVIVLLIFATMFITACHKATWRDKTVKTLDLIHAHLLTESPGAIDPDNPGFMKNMAIHYQQALSMANQVNDYAGYYQVLNYFITSFQDSNIYLSHFAAPLSQQDSVEKPLPFAMTQLTPDTLWFSWPTFSLDDTQTMLWVKKIVNFAPSLRDEQNMVIDLRGNAQGDFNWGAVFLKKLYGVAYYQWLMSQSQQMVNQYRVSDYAIASVQQSAQQLKNTFGSSSPETVQINTTLNTLNAVFERGDQWYPASLPAQSSASLTSTVRPAPLYRGRLVLIADGRCNNACLNFIMLAKQFPQVELLGQTTNADTVYTHASEPVYLDDGAQLHFGCVIEQHRRRGSNQPYQPDERYTGDMSDTTALQSWVLSQIE